MSERKVKVNGVMTAVSLDKNKKYKYNKSGDLVEATVVSDSDIIIAGSKSSLRRIADLERNVSILATQLTTTDGAATDTDDESFSTTITHTTRFKATVRQDAVSDHRSNIDMNGNKIVEVGTPSAATDAANKSYVDTAVTNGLNSKDPVITLTGDVTGTGTMTNLGSVSITTAVANDSHTHAFGNLTGRPTTLAGYGITDSMTSSAVTSAISAATSALTNGASAAFDTLKEIQDAMATDAELSAAISGLTIGNGTMTVAAGTGITGGGAFSANQTGASTLTISHADTSTVASVTASGRKYVTGLTFDGFGHVTGVTTGTETVVDTVVTNTNQLTNGSGYVTSSGVTSVGVTAGNGLTGGGTVTTTGAVALNVGGGNGITVSADGVAMSGSFTGNFTATGDITAYSDDRLKTDVVTIDGAMDRVSAIRGVNFTRISDGSRSTGVVAQELKAVLPEAVHTDENGVHHVAYGNVVGLLIEAVKELKAEIEALKY